MSAAASEPRVEAAPRESYGPRRRARAGGGGSRPRVLLEQFETTARARLETGRVAAPCAGTRLKPHRLSRKCLVCRQP